MESVGKLNGKHWRFKYICCTLTRLDFNRLLHCVTIFACG